MKKTIACLSACTALFAAAPCIVHAADDAMVQKANAAWDKTFNSGDAKKLASLYDENAVVSPGNGKTVKGRADIEKLFDGYFKAGVGNHTTDVVNARRVGNVLYETANWTAVADKDGKKTQYQGVLLKVMTKSSDGQWRTTAHTWNAAQ
ncbi:YybH family protein [Caballeronia grimmiae]|uniref:YybH family protein n=1 Tax=Caballeronia grimmiae TaxID=1071679 RepID=UPI0038BA7BCA